MILALNRLTRRGAIRVAITNRVLRAFSEDVRRRLQPHLEAVRLPVGKILYEPGEAMRHAFFPEGAVVSLLALTMDGAAAELAMVAAEGFIGLSIVLPINTAPYQVLVQTGGVAHRLRADILRAEFRRDMTVQDVVLGYLQRQVTAMAQASVCNRFHNVRQRLCRWLLLAQDCAHTDTIELTQEFLGHVLGTTRKRVSYAASQLQDTGCIRQRHGLIKILDRRGLEQRACECYAVVREQVAQPAHSAPRILATGSHGPHLR
jgi:CRP-like cAMP-binding protein